MKRHKEIGTAIRRFLTNRNHTNGFTESRKTFAPRSREHFGVANHGYLLRNNKHTRLEFHDHAHTRLEFHDHAHTRMEFHDHAHTRMEFHDHASIHLSPRNLSHAPQWGYMKISANDRIKNEKIKYEDEAILFVNNTNHTTKTGEENREVYYDIKDATLILDDNVRLTIQVAYNFDFVRKKFSYPNKRDWEEREDEESGQCYMTWKILEDPETPD